MDPIHPIGPRDRDVEPVQRLKPLRRDGGRERPDQQHEEARRGDTPQRESLPEQPPPPENDDGNPHVDVRV